MQIEDTSYMFNFSYHKSSKEITDKLATKVTQLKSKIEERKTRIKALREEYKITDAIYIDLLEQARKDLKNRESRMSYSVSNAPAKKNNGLTEETITIGAGVVNNLLTETDLFRDEEAKVTRFELICRNLQDLKDDEGEPKGHRLSEEELTYLGF